MIPIGNVYYHLDKGEKEGRLTEGTETPTSKSTRKILSMANKEALVEIQKRRRL